MPAESILVIDGGLTNLSLGRFVFGETGPSLQAHYTAACVPQASDEVSQVEAWISVLKDLCKTHKISGKAIWVLPSRYAFTTMLRFPHVEPSKQAQLIAFEASQCLPYPLKESIWDSTIIADDGSQIGALLGAAKASLLALLTQGAESCGIELNAIYPRSIVDAALYNASSPKGNRAALLMHFGEEHIHFTFCDHHQVFIRCAAFLQKNFSEDAFLSTLDATINHYEKQTGQIAPAHCLLSGSAASRLKAADSLRARYGDAATLWNPLDHFDLKPAERVQSEDSLANLYAAALLTINPEFTSVNLLPMQVLRDRLLKREKPWLAIAGLCLALTPVPYWLFFKKMRSEYELQEAQVQQEIVQVNALNASIEDGQARLAALESSIQNLEKLGAAEMRWSDFLSDLQDRLYSAKDVWLDSLEHSRDEHGKPLDQHIDLAGRLLLTRDSTPGDTTFSQETASLRVYELVESLGRSDFIERVEEVSFDTKDRQILKFRLGLVMTDKSSL